MRKRSEKHFKMTLTTSERIPPRFAVSDEIFSEKAVFACARQKMDEKTAFSETANRGGNTLRSC